MKYNKFSSRAEFNQVHKEYIVYIVYLFTVYLTPQKIPRLKIKSRNKHKKIKENEKMH